jgi:hypothetical protein
MDLLAMAVYGTILFGLMELLEVRMHARVLPRANEQRPARWRFELSVQARLYLTHCRMLLPVTEGLKRSRGLTRSLWTMLDTG